MKSIYLSIVFVASLIVNTGAAEGDSSNGVVNDFLLRLKGPFFHGVDLFKDLLFGTSISVIPEAPGVFDTTLNLSHKGRISFDRFAKTTHKDLEVGFGMSGIAISGTFRTLVVEGNKDNEEDNYAVVKKGTTQTLQLSHPLSYIGLAMKIRKLIDFVFFYEEKEIERFAAGELIKMLNGSYIAKTREETQEVRRSLERGDNGDDAEDLQYNAYFSFVCPSGSCHFDRLDIVNKGSNDLVTDNLTVGFAGLSAKELEVIGPLTNEPVTKDVTAGGFGKTFSSTPVIVGSSVGAVALIALLSGGGYFAVKRANAPAKLELLGAEFGGTAYDCENVDRERTDELGEDEFV